MEGNLLIIGAGGHTRVVIDAAVKSGYNLLGIIDINFTGAPEEIMGCKVIGDYSVLTDYPTDSTNVFIAIGDPSLREKYFNIVTQDGYAIPTLIHPTAIISDNAQIDDGSFINAGVIINAKAQLMTGCIINTGSIIDHEVSIGKFTHIAPGVSISGRTVVGNNSFVGTGTAVIDKITIGNNVIIGAGSTIIKDIESGNKVVGVSKTINK